MKTGDKTVLRVALIIMAFLVAVGCVFLLFLPLSARVEGEDSDEHYLCTWENGAVTQEQYVSAYSALVGVSGDGIMLMRGGLLGTVEGSALFVQAAQVLQSGSLLELLTLKTEGINRLEQAALYRTFGCRGYYSEELFAYDGVRVFRTERKVFDELILLSGDLPQGLLSEAGANKLIIREEAELSAKGLVGSYVVSAEASAPYVYKNGAIYLETLGGRRLVAVLPNVKTLTIDCDFIDEGALAPCRSLEELTLPAGFGGTLRQIFGEAGVPDTLRRLNGETFDL